MTWASMSALAASGIGACEGHSLAPARREPVRVRGVELDLITAAAWPCWALSCGPSTQPAVAIRAEVKVQPHGVEFYDAVQRSGREVQSLLTDSLSRFSALTEDGIGHLPFANNVSGSVSRTRRYLLTLGARSFAMIYVPTATSDKWVQHSRMTCQASPARSDAGFSTCRL